MHFVIDVGTVDARVARGDERVVDKLLAVDNPAALRSNEKQLKLWDGLYHFFEAGKFPAGLAPRLKRRLEKRGHTVELVYDPPLPKLKMPARDCLVGIDLRDHQVDGVAEGIEHCRGLFDHATNAGKSECMAAIITALLAAEIRPTLVIVPNINLLHQLAARFKKRFGRGVSVSRLGDTIRENLDVDVVVATQGTLLRALPEKMAYDKSTKKNKITRVHDRALKVFLLQLDAVFADECFPCDVFVGDCPISDVRVGDVVPSFDEIRGELVTGTVTATMRNRPRHLVRVWFDDGTSIACTPGHPFWIYGYGWMIASRLRAGLHVIRYMDEMSLDMYSVRMRNRKASAFSESPESIVLRSVYSVTSSGTQCVAGSENDLSNMRDFLDGDRQECPFSVGSRRADRVFTEMHGDLSVSDSLSYDGGYESSIRECVDVCAKSYATRGYSSARFGASSRNGALSAGSRRQWAWIDGPASADVHVTSTSGRWVGYGVPCFYRRHDSRVPANLLQVGHRASIRPVRRGSGREQSSGAGTSSERRAAGRVPTLCRVVRVEVLEPGCDGTFGGVCPDGYVYNLEVAGTHTYLANGVVVHNCHHATADGWKEILKLCRSATVRLGFTGSVDKRSRRRLGGEPLEADKVKERMHVYELESYLGPVLHTVRNKEMVAKGFSAKPRAYIIVDPKAYGPNQIVALVERDKHGDVIKKDYYGEVFRRALTEDPIFRKTVRRVTRLLINQEKPPFVFSHSVDLLDALQKTFANCDNPVPCEMLFGQDSTNRRQSALSRYSSRQDFALLTSSIFDEGADVPEIRSIVLAGARMAARELLQRLGRSLRAKKEDNTVVMVDFFPAHAPMLGVHAEEREAIMRDEGVSVTYIRDVSRLSEIVF